jgi:hypothetical protein
VTTIKWRFIMNKKIENECCGAAMKWYGWGSPVGLTIFLIGLSICVFLVRLAFEA